MDIEKLVEECARAAYELDPTISIEGYPIDWEQTIRQNKERQKARAVIAMTLKAAAEEATKFLVGDPVNGIPLRTPMPHEISDHIRFLAKQMEKSNG